MNTSEQLVVNKLPTRTWNHLQVNEATIPWNVADTADLGTDSYAITAENQAQPLHIDLTGAAGFSRKHIAVEVAAGVQATVYMVLDTQGSFAVETALTLHDHASLHLVQVLGAQDGALLYAKTDADCAPGASVDMTQILMGQGDLYSDNDTELVGDGSHYSAQIGYLGRGSQTIDVNVVVNHYGKNTECEIDTSGALKDAAKKVFRGTIDFKTGSATRRRRCSCSATMSSTRRCRSSSAPRKMSSATTARLSVSSMTRRCFTLKAAASPALRPKTSWPAPPSSALPARWTTRRCARRFFRRWRRNSTMTYDYKQDFPIFQRTDVAYIDNAATAQRPQCVLDAVADFYRCHNANPLRGLYPLSVEATDIYEQARETVRDFIGARSAREIVFTRNTTESLNLVAYSYGLTHVKAGDEVLVSIMEHHSDLLPWQMVCRQTGAELKFIECAPDGSVDLQQIESLITERTQIVAMTQVSNVLGRKYPVKEVAAMAHKKGAVMVVDGAQSTPHMPVNVQELGADFFAFSGHKVFGPMGIGGLYGREDLLEEMPPFLSGGEMIESVTRTGAVYAELPHKFEAGTVNAAGAAGLAAAIRYVQSVGFDTIQQREHGLTANALARVLAVPHVHVLGTDRPEDHNGIITFTVDGVHPHDISEIMASDGVNIRAGHHCAQPLLAHLGLNATARASFAFYNTDEDVDRFLESLSTLRERMGYGK